MISTTNCPLDGLQGSARVQLAKGDCNDLEKNLASHPPNADVPSGVLRPFFLAGAELNRNPLIELPCIIH